MRRALHGVAQKQHYRQNIRHTIHKFAKEKVERRKWKWKWKWFWWKAKRTKSTEINNDETPGTYFKVFHFEMLFWSLYWRWQCGCRSLFSSLFRSITFISCFEWPYFTACYIACRFVLLCIWPYIFDFLQWKWLIGAKWCDCFAKHQCFPHMLQPIFASILILFFFLSFKSSFHSFALAFFFFTQDSYLCNKFSNVFRTENVNGFLERHLMSPVFFGLFLQFIVIRFITVCSLV